MPELNLPTLSNSRLKMISLTSGERDFSVQLEGFLSAPDIAAFHRIYVSRPCLSAYPSSRRRSTGFGHRRPSTLHTSMQVKSLAYMPNSENVPSICRLSLTVASVTSCIADYRYASSQ